MNNQEYWELRRAREMYQHMEEAEKLARELDIAYRKAALYLQGEAEQIFNKYQDKYNLTRAEAELLLKNSKVPENIEELKQLLTKDKERYKELLQELETPAYKARIDNLANVYGQLDSIVLPMIANERRKHIALYKKLAEDAYYQTIFDLQQYSGYGFDFKALDKKTIQKVLDTRWTAKSFSQSIWDNTHALAESVKREILVNLLTGRPLVKAQQAIQEEFQSGSNAARRLVRTESAYVCNQLQIEGYKACGVERYIYVAILDLKTSQICRSLDKEDFAVDDAKVGVNYPPMHPWCRSTTIAYVAKEILAKMKQSAIDPATGKRITVPGDMTYKEWYKLYVKGKAEVAEKKIKYRTADKKQFEEYQTVLKDNSPEKLDDFQNIKYTNSEKWEYLKGLKEYLKQYPDSSKSYYDIQQELKALGIKIGVPLPPKPKQAFILPEGKRDAFHIMHRMLERGITDDMVRSYMTDAKCMFVQWGGQRQAFYGDNGVSVITKAGDDWIYKTTWSKNDFDSSTEQIMEVINKHVK